VTRERHPLPDPTGGTIRLLAAACTASAGCVMQGCTSMAPYMHVLCFRTAYAPSFSLPYLTGRGVLIPSPSLSGAPYTCGANSHREGAHIHTSPPPWFVRHAIYMAVRILTGRGGQVAPPRGQRQHLRPLARSRQWCLRLRLLVSEFFFNSSVHTDAPLAVSCEMRCTRYGYVIPYREGRLLIGAPSYIGIPHGICYVCMRCVTWRANCISTYPFL
jgi:hypothetical protein